jgi:L-arabinose transport system ATP-binding protein
MDTGKSDAVPLPAQLPVISATGLGMTFPGVRALEGIAISIPAGEVHAIVGENGAGKSTLIRILSGEIADYDGELRLDGSHVRFTSPRDAIARGIAVIPQELLLVGPLTASENICLGHEPQTARRWLDRRGIDARGAAALAPLGEAALAASRSSTCRIDWQKCSGSPIASRCCATGSSWRHSPPLRSPRGSWSGS